MQTENLFKPGKIGSLKLPNRLVRSATAERMANDSGRPRPPLASLYRDLVRGEVGLIITGHMYVHPSGKAHPEMTGIYRDDLIPGLASLAETVHQEGGRIITQINHGGMQCDPQTVEDPIAPSAVGAPRFERTARQMSLEELEMLIEAYSQAARRTKEAGFDGVQIHAAHGYLISEFLSPYTNRRSDQWGGDLNNRMRFLREVIRSVRAQVGSEYPVLIKLGMMDGIPGGLTLEDSLQVVGALEELGVDGVELSGGIQGKHLVNVRKGIRSAGDEAYFLKFAQAAKTITRLPVLLVGGFRSRDVMENVLSDGHADFISLCRPLINDPYFPQQIRLGLRGKSRCISSNNCWAERAGEGIACKCPIDKGL